MTTVSKFKQLAEFVTDITQKRKKEADIFLQFYKELVETMPSEVCKTFGNMSVVGSDDKKYGIELTVADYLYWKDSFERGIYFKNGPEKVKQAMMRHLSNSVEETGSLTAEERKLLLSILIDKE